MTLTKQKENDAVVAVDLGGDVLEYSSVANYTDNLILSITNQSLEGENITDIVALKLPENNTNPSLNATNN